MIRATTPTFKFTIKSETLDLNQADSIYVTFAQGSRKITKDGDDVKLEGERVVSVWLTQEESLALSEGPLECQINWIYHDAYGNYRRAATIIKQICVTKQLLRRIIE